MTQIEEPLLSWLILVARLCLATVFVVSGVHKSVWYRKAVEEFRQAGIPAIGFSLPMTIALHILAPIGLITGMYVRTAALALAFFTFVATVKVHCFWRMEGRMRLERSRVALANLALVGGLILLAATGPGRLVL